jgi:hypothetical protein
MSVSSELEPHPSCLGLRLRPLLALSIEELALIDFGYGLAPAPFADCLGLVRRLLAGGRTTG